MKKVFVFLFTILSFYSNAQKNNKQLFYLNQANYNDANVGQLISCNNVPNPTGCNLISNNTFIPTGDYNPVTNFEHLRDPFEAAPFNLIPNWAATHGTPHIAEFNITSQPPNPIWTVLPPENIPGLPNGINYVYSFTSPTFDPILEPSTHEGIVQRIPNLVAGRTYFFSFFARITNPHNLDKFNIRLLNCEDALAISTYPFAKRKFDMPNWSGVPNQSVYCQTMTNFAWMRFTFTFVANSSNYNAISISPENPNEPSPRKAIVRFAYPELLDVTNFSAGPQPNPTPPNCTVTIGPTTPNCGVINAVYKWVGPYGQEVIAPASQQIQVDATQLINIGTWTLHMTVPNAVAPNGCGETASITATVTIPNSSCTTNPAPWPKAYQSTIKMYQFLIKAPNTSNLFLTQGFSLDPNYSYNHSGYIPASQTARSVQYNNNGYTTWASETQVPLFCYKSGIVRMSDNSYVDGANGIAVNPPVMIPNSDDLFSETNSNEFFTYVPKDEINGQPPKLKVYWGNTVNTTLLNNDVVVFRVYNPSTRRVLLCNTPPNTPPTTLYIYRFDPILKKLDFETSKTLPVTEANDIRWERALIDNQDRIYFINNGVLKRYDYLTGINGTVTTLSIPGFVNSNLVLISNVDNYTSNRLVVLNQANQYLYSIDVSNNTTPIVKKVLCQNANLTTLLRAQASFENNDVYIGGTYRDFVHIGNQFLPPMTSIRNKAFVTKLNLLTDFNSLYENPVVNTEISKSKENFSFSLITNPVTNNLLGLKIIENDKTTSGAYNLTITDKMGNVLLRSDKYFSSNSLNISKLEKGYYLVTLIDKNNEKHSLNFLKF